MIFLDRPAARTGLLSLVAVVCVLVACQASAQAQALPQYDIQASCEKYSTSHDPKFIQMCVRNQQLMFDLLQMDWHKYSTELKMTCIARITPQTLLPNMTLGSCLEGGAP